MGFVSVADYWDANASEYGLLQNDNLHPKNEGHQFLADVILRAIDPSEGVGGPFVGKTIPQIKSDVLRVTSATYAATVTPNADTTDVLNIGALTGDITIAAPTGTPKDGQTLTIRFVQDATGSRTVTWNAAFAFGTDITAAQEPTAASAKWERTFEWNATDSKWQATGIVRGF